MKKTWKKSVLGLAVAFVLIVMPLTAFAAQPPEGAEITDIYSSWAGFDVFMASTVYGFGNEGTYSNFRGRLMTEKFAPVYASLADALGSDVTLDLQPGELVTRGQTVAALYALLSGEAAGADEAAEYFASEGLMRGRAPGDYQLDAICTVEEMIALSVRTYEYAVRAAGEDSKGFFWEIRGENNTVYLLGSIHLGDNVIYPLSEKIMTAFDRSANLVVEVDVANMSLEDILYIQSLQMVDYENGETIADYLSEETFELYVTLVEALELPEEFYYLKPWAATLTLTTIFMSTGDVEESSAIGVDMLLLNKAYSMYKNILELESTRFQIEMFDSFSRELQELQLLEVLSSVLGTQWDGEGADDADGETDDSNGDTDDDLAGAELQEIMAMFLAAIKAGDDDVFGAMMAMSRAIDKDDPLAVEYDTAMWAHRNIGMANGIAEYLESGTEDGDYFVVVGAGHLFGEDSVVILLAEMGYEVVRVK